MPRRALWSLAVVAVTAALVARAQIATLPLPGSEAAIVAKPGPQREPALSSPFASFIAYTDLAQTPRQVWYCRLEGLVCPSFQVPASSGDQFAPAVAGDVLVYVDEGAFGPRKGNVIRMSITQGIAAAVSPADAFQGAPAVSDRVIAWEDDRDVTSGRDIWVHDVLLGGEWPITGAGFQHGPRVSGTLVSYLDDAAGAVKVYDLATGVTTVAYPAMAAFADVDGTAVAVQTLDGDLEVRSVDGASVASLVLPGLQSNPHLSGDWVAFEDNSTQVSRVIVWNWRTGDLYAPPAGTSSQTLNDICWPRVVYVDDRSPTTGQDIYLYDTSATAPDGGTDGGADGGTDGGVDGGTDGGADGGGDGGVDGGTDGGADGGADGGVDGGGSCEHAGGDDGEDGHGHGHDHGDHHGHGGGDDERGHGHDRDKGGGQDRCAGATAAPLAELRVLRERGGPDSGRIEFSAEAEGPVLVCIDACDVSSAWVLLDDEAVARPDDFDPWVRHLEVRRGVAAGRNRLSALVAGRPGASLTVRLVPDPGGGPAPVAGAGLRAPGPVASSWTGLPPAQGCSQGAAGPGALLFLATWLLAPRRRRT